MEVYIDYAKLEVMLADFFLLTQMRIGFWDNNSRCIVSCGESCSEFCRSIQQNPALLKECNRCEEDGLKRAKRYPHMLHAFHCHAGMNEFIFPVVYEQVILGYFMYGQVHVSDMKNDWETRGQLYEKYGLVPEEMETLYCQLPKVTTAFMESAGRMLGNLAKYSHLSGLIKVQGSILSDQVREYIEQNYFSPLTIGEVSGHLFISPSTLSHALAKQKKTTFVKMLNSCRVDHVKRHLRHGDSLSDATYKAGFHSENYMSRMFKQKEGMTPSQFRDSAIHK